MVPRLTFIVLVNLGVVCLITLVNGLSVTTNKNSVWNREVGLSSNDNRKELLRGDWERAKWELRDRNCCVVSVNGLKDHLMVLQEQLVENGPADLDLRARIRCGSSVDGRDDCRSILQSCAIHHSSQPPLPLPLVREECTEALWELASGIASLAQDDGPLQNKIQGVFARIVCASEYKAHDPMFHTDKAPLRGYVTLRGVGTQFMKRTSSPLEYMQLRTLGVDCVKSNDVREANELEFIIMKGDYYPQYEQNNLDQNLMDRLWLRSSACVHRSPPSPTDNNVKRRVILSFDLADGDDDRQWYQANQKRSWRSGMTQRKSRLVS